MKTFNVDEFMQELIDRTPIEKDFHQSVREVMHSIEPYIKEHPKYLDDKLLERLIEPERIIAFRVPWVDDKGDVQVNRGWRVQFNSAIGPYKGGIRFAPDVTLDTVKFLAFEMIFKNSLTSLPLGAAKGGADFDPAGKSDGEIMRFCQSFMTELYRYIGPDTDVPAGDLGVGHKEVGYMFGQYKRIMNEFTGVITGKKVNWGGSLIRPEATGYGVAYFAQCMLETIGEKLEGKTVSVSGYGNVGSFLIEKLDALGAKVVTAADPFGYIYDPDGISGEKLDFIKDLWVVHRRPIKDYADKFGVEYVEGKGPWEVPVDVAIPSSRQNELNLDDAKTLVKNGVLCVCEAANMPTTEDAMQFFVEKELLYAPGKAANAGGVAVSGLEMAQNSMHYSWSAEEVDEKLHTFMENIHQTCIDYGKKENGYVNYVDGANIGGFIKVADAMIDLGVV
ncbi:NADP-specific glutamate dehydrogenase [Vagococcus acidifermentans]|uniref:Glutamate dehydrogenase n=1 Tax=Vagococcus acidifermentans TaxID=564710 RepID=A0A430B2R4_9ENTE|nr:NADP-specific glutamate dehydrogenase [Vagococcus acidifermentans]RSU14627.1 glutamate dehydrogenase [Vagococcus acidifermentans]